VPPCGQPAAAHKAWTTLRVAHTAHSPDDGAFRLPSRCQRITISTTSSGTAFGGNARELVANGLFVSPLWILAADGVPTTTLDNTSEESNARDRKTEPCNSTWGADRGI